MKKAFATFTILLLVAFLPFLNLASANPEVYASMPKLKIDSPIGNTAYNTSVVSFEITGQVRHDQLINQAYPFFSCSLDGYNFKVNATYNSETSDGWMVFNGKIDLIELSNGQHSVSVSHISNSQIATIMGASVSFTVSKANNTSAIPIPVAPNFSVNFGGIKLNAYPNETDPYADFTINNQDFQTVLQGQKLDLYYYFRWKPHTDSSWQNYTVPIVAKTSPSNTTFFSLRLFQVTENRQVSGAVDFQVAARAISITEESAYVGQRSDWSSTQTIIIPSSNDLPTPTPSVPEFSWLSILPILLSIPIALAAVRKRIQRNV